MKHTPVLLHQFELTAAQLHHFTVQAFAAGNDELARHYNVTTAISAREICDAHPAPLHFAQLAFVLFEVARFHLELALRYSATNDFPHDQAAAEESWPAYASNKRDEGQDAYFWRVLVPMPALSAAMDHFREALAAAEKSGIDYAINKIRSQQAECLMSLLEHMPTISADDRLAPFAEMERGAANEANRMKPN
jgi:hypothetical protein